ncbi:hypothetical protein [Arthrobacter sp. H20]|uniref:hypothetical protein n=1 Tax=Arthrobacter sp. H20 TaxID=1267981 RepID=UPI0004ACCEA6|nr:hypothetical protein [Arthrobacter sp. H20]
MAQPGPYWVALALASASGRDRDGLAFAKAAIERFVPLSVLILVTAASEKIAVIY